MKNIMRFGIEKIDNGFLIKVSNKKIHKADLTEVLKIITSEIKSNFEK